MRKIVAITVAVLALGWQLTGHEDLGPGFALERDVLVSDATAANEATETAVSYGSRGQSPSDFLNITSSVARSASAFAVR